jgi:hypothetical protein
MSVWEKAGAPGHDPEKACPREGGDGHWFSEKIMLKQKVRTR